MSKKPEKQQKSRIGNPNLAEEGKPYRWKPGQSGNPKGRPKGLSLITNEVIRQLEDEWLDGKGNSTLVELARTIIVNAMNGNGAVIKELFSRVDGLLVQEVEQTTNVNITYTSEITPDGQVITTKHLQEPDSIH